MYKIILRLIHVERKSEERPAILLLGYGFFMGVFLATYRVVAEALFLDTLGQELDMAFVYSGAIGIASTWLYAFLQKRISFSKLTIFNILAVLSYISFLYLNLFFGESEVLIYALYLMLLPITSIMLLSFWGMFGRIFDLRQSKRIIGSIDAGQLIATIIAFLVTPFLISLLGNVPNLLLLSIGSLIICLLFLIFLVGQFHAIPGIADGTENIQKGNTNFFKNNYAVLLSVFIAISVICYTLIDYTFLKITELQYPDQNSLARFLAYIYLAIMLFTLFMQTFVNEKLISNYGLKITLIILPVILIFFTVVSIINGVFFVDTTIVQVSFGFFLLMGIIKFFSQSLRESLESPTFKLFFMPLNIRIRFDVQARVEGVINELARFIGGLIIFGLGALAFFKLIHYSYFLFAVVIGYFFVTGKLYNEYRNSVKKKLEKEDDDVENIEKDDIVLEKMIRDNFQSRDSGIKIFTVNMVDKIDQSVVKKVFPLMLSDPDKLLKKYALIRLNDQRNLSGILKPERVFTFHTKNDADGAGEDIGQWLNKLLNVSESSKFSEDLSRLVSSEKTEDRIQALNLFLNNPVDEAYPYLVELLNDLDPNVKSAAIMVAGKIRKADMYPYLIEQLSSSTFGDKAIISLVEIGEDVIPYLEVAFFKTGQDAQTQNRILKIYEKIGTESAKEALWAKVDFPDKIIVSQVLISLASSGYKVEGYQSTRIKYVIESDINSILWNLSALNRIPADEIGLLISKSLKEENEYHFNHIYMLLSMIFDNYSINLVKSNLESKTSEGITYALELLDVLLTEDLKDRIIPLFDDITDDEKVKRLQVFYPHILGDYKEVIKQLINKEFNQINRWTKTLALYWVGLNKDKDFKYELISNLFNPDIIMKEIASWSLFMVDQNLYEEHTERLSKKEKTQLDLKIHPAKFHLNVAPGQLAFKKVFFLGTLPIFKNLSGIQLVYMVDFLQEFILSPGEVQHIRFENNRYFYIVFDGYLNFRKREIIVNNFSTGDFIGELLIEKKEDQYFELIPLKKSIIFRIEKDKLYDILSSDHSEGIKFLKGLKDINSQVPGTLSVSA